MNKLISLVLITFSYFNVNAQLLSKEDLNNTNWFSNNSDSTFLKSDTIHLIKHSNKVSGGNTNEFSESEYLNHGNYVSLNFKKRQRLQFWETRNNYINFVPIDKFTWGGVGRFSRTQKLRPILKKHFRIIANSGQFYSISKFRWCIT